MSQRVGAYLVTCALLLAGSSAAITPEEKCEAAKNKIAGKYAFCRQRSEAKAILKGGAADYSKCDTQLSDKWGKAEQKAIDKGTACIDSVSALDEQTFVTAHAAAVAAALDGGDLPDCGDGTLNAVGELCDGVDLGGEGCATLGYGGGTLACDEACGFDTTSCIGGAGLVPGVDPILPATGQVTAYGTGSDGDVQAGQARSYTDNGDGTITDNNTGLVWEKKDDSGGIHDKNNNYTWSTGTNNMDGTITTTFLATLNGGGGVAGHTDWRIPNVTELQSLVAYKVVSPAVDPAFQQAATCTGCADVTLATCSCTASSFYFYWSSTSYASSPVFAWLVSFSDGTVGYNNKTNSLRVRAVRVGL